MASSPAAWPLLSRVLSEVKSANDLVRWGLDAWGCRRVVGLRELRVAAVLFASSQDAGRSSAAPDWEGVLDVRFNEEAPSMHYENRENDVLVEVRSTHISSSLLDLAIRFGHAELARCLRACGLEQQQALRPKDLQSLPVGSLAKMPLEIRMESDSGKEALGEIQISEWKQERSLRAWPRECWCRPRDGDWKKATMKLGDPAIHTWQYWPDDTSAAAGQEHRASDWKDPTPWARALVDSPATRAALALAAEGLLPELAEDAKPRLLDAALLLGDPEAAAALARSCGPRRPLRVWDATLARPRLSAGHPAAEYAEAHLRAGLRDLRGLGFARAADVAMRAVEAGAPGLARAVAEFLPEGVQEMKLQCHRVTERDSLDNAVLREGTLPALETFGPLAQGCSVRAVVLSAGTQKTRALCMPLLLLPALLGDERAAARLVRAGLTLQGSTGSGGLGDADLEHLRAGFAYDVGDLKPVAIRLEVAEHTLQMLAMNAWVHARSAVAATGRRGLLARSGLVDHIAAFAAAGTDGEAVLRQELTRMLGRDPLGNLEFRPGAVGPIKQAALVAPPSQAFPEEATQQAAGGRSAEPSASASAAPAQQPPLEPWNARLA